MQVSLFDGNIQANVVGEVMREIEFRGKSKNSGRWVYGDLITQKYNSRQGIHIYEKNDKLERGYQFVRVNKNTLGQYTGLTDKNGTKIFEGDIVRVFSDCDGYYIEKEYIYGVVVYEDEFGFGYEISFSHIRNSCDEYLGNHRDDIEVVGNIYEHHELLGENYDN